MNNIKSFNLGSYILSDGNNKISVPISWERISNRCYVSSYVYKYTSYDKYPCSIGNDDFLEKKVLQLITLCGLRDIPGVHIRSITLADVSDMGVGYLTSARRLTIERNHIKEVFAEYWLNNRCTRTSALFVDSHGELKTAHILEEKGIRLIMEIDEDFRYDQD